MVEPGGQGLPGFEEPFVVPPRGMGYRRLIDQMLSDQGLDEVEVLMEVGIVEGIKNVEFFRDVLGPLARRMRLGVWFARTVDGVDLDDPVEAAEGRAVFELHQVQ